MSPGIFISHIADKYVGLALKDFLRNAFGNELSGVLVLRLRKYTIRCRLARRHPRWLKAKCCRLGVVSRSIGNEGMDQLRGWCG